MESIHQADLPTGVKKYDVMVYERQNQRRQELTLVETNFNKFNDIHKAIAVICTDGWCSRWIM